MRTCLAESRIINGKSVLYRLLAERIGSQAEAYGISVSCGDTKSEISGISLSQSRILTLFDQLIRGEVTPTGLRDVVDDWLLL